jgi:hypothetical protein
MGGNPGFFGSTAEQKGMKTHALDIGQSVEL